jgi:hypothetical protein
MKILNNSVVRYTLILVAGIAIGAIFYPSKSITREEQRKYEREIEKLKIQKEVTEKIFEKKLDEESKSHKKYKEETEKKVSVLREENYKLKQKVSEKKFRIVKPDGTIIEKWFKDSEIEQTSSIVTNIKLEFNRKVKSIENKWKKVHEERVVKIKEEFDQKIKEKDHIIASLKKKETIKINERKFGVAVGRMSDEDYYTNISYDIAGPLFLNMQVESNFDNSSAVGFGIGLRF